MSEDMEPRRRGRPPLNAAPADASVNETGVADGATPTKRRRRASVNGMNFKLKVPEREGYKRRWFNDTAGRIAMADDLAYDHVRDTSIRSDGTDSRIRRLVGTKPDGSPMYAYLMETPVEEYQRGIEEKEQIHRAVDEAIREGRDATGRVSNSYGEGSIR